MGRRTLRLPDLNVGDSTATRPPVFTETLTARDNAGAPCSDSVVRWSFEILPGLPGTGPYPEQFTTHGGTHREGFVVRFSADDGDTWVGNFQRGFGGRYLSAVFEHPAATTFVVVSGGQAYVVEPTTRRSIETFGANICAGVGDEQRLVFATDTEAIVLEPAGRWVSDRLAWDGIAELKLDGDRLTGQGRDALNDEWRPIELDLQSHAVLESAYEFQAAPPPRGQRARLRALLSSLVSRIRARKP